MVSNDDNGGVCTKKISGLMQLNQVVEGKNSLDKNTLCYCILICNSLYIKCHCVVGYLLVPHISLSPGLLSLNQFESHQIYVSVI